MIPPSLFSRNAYEKNGNIGEVILLENDVQCIINKIKDGLCSNKELCYYLESKLVLIKANAILKIIDSQNKEMDIIYSLNNLSKKVEQEPIVFSIWNTGHFAMAALKILDTDVSLALFENNFKKLDKVIQQDIEDLIEYLKKAPIQEL